MVGGLFGVHTIDMGMCSSFTRGSTSERRKALFYYLFLWEGCCRVSKFSFFLFISFEVYSYHVLLSFLFFSFGVCIAWPLSRVKSAWHGHMCALGILFEVCDLGCLLFYEGLLEKQLEIDL